MAKGGDALRLLVQHEDGSVLLDQTQTLATLGGGDRSSGYGCTRSPTPSPPKPTELREPEGTLLWAIIAKTGTQDH